ncbi:FAD-binding oxidoreductase [Pseudonocardia adelaidensis]|uniref:FAD-binding oxidoreductase n=1 Tax=Pseudonocardia adelaidensis TaxID=648754 RepID=A0ABP9NS96_9PSEU
MVDLSEIRHVTVDPAARRARCGGGCTWADVDAATQQHGLAVTGGMVSHTGIGGLTLGGGVGWLMHRHGLVVDNLVAAEVVLADGRIVRTSAERLPDLFWAVRGGGGNFGVVTEFEYRLHPVGPEVHLAFLFWPQDQMEAALKLSRDTARRLPPDSAGIPFALNAPPAPFVPEELHGALGCAFLVAGFGTAEEHAALVEPIVQALPPAVRFVTPMPYTALQQMFDEAPFAWGVQAYTRGLYFDRFSDDAISVLAEHLPRKSSPLTAVPMFLFTGACAEVGDDDTAFGGSRSAECMLVIDVIATDAETLAADRTWARTMWDALRPLATNTGSYVNALAEQDDDRIRDSYGRGKYERLAEIKAIYDPGNLFHRNANIKPA